MKAGLSRGAAAAEVVRLPRAVVGHAGDLQRLGLVGHGAHRVRRGGDHHDVDAVVGDEVAGDGRGAVGVGLRVLDDDLDRVDEAVAAHDAVLDGGLPLLDEPLVGLAEGRERSGERADEADLDRAAVACVGRAAAAVVAAAAARGEHAPEPARGAQGDARHAGRLEEVATRDGRPDALRRLAGLAVLRTHTASLRGPSAPPPSVGDAGGRDPPDGLLVSDATNGCSSGSLPHPSRACQRRLVRSAPPPWLVHHTDVPSHDTGII